MCILEIKHDLENLGLKLQRIKEKYPNYLNNPSWNIVKQKQDRLFKKLKAESKATRCLAYRTNEEQMHPAIITVPKGDVYEII